MKKIYLLIILIFISVNTAKTMTEDPDVILSQVGNYLNKKESGEKTLKEEVEELKARVEDLEDTKAELEEVKKQVNIINALKISGFFDVSISNYKNKPNVFLIGPFELDIEHNYEHFQVAAALVFYEGADLRTGFIDYHLFGSRISPTGRLFWDEGLHLQIGRFDVPFGNDWRYFPSKDRITVTPPLTTELIMDGGYNDEGVRLLFNLVSINASLYMLQGVEEQYSYGGNSFGGRIGITPFNNPFSIRSGSIPPFELGFSYIVDIDRNGDKAEKLYSCDMESKIGPLILSSEYYYRDKSAGILLYGYHVTGGIDFSYFSKLPVILFGRFDRFTSEEIVSINYAEGTDKNSLSRITAGVNINIARISYLKFEYQNYISAYNEFITDQYYNKMLYYLQLVIRF
ncbi:MAG: hypothetical protein JXN64_16235 [Spirochaetes bacterium]|nr:hypothetical protein [Spirochaetota bacterium]